MIARPAGRRAGLRSQIEDQAGQTRTRPIRRSVVARLVDIVAFLAVAGDVREDQTRIDLGEFFVADLKPFGDLRRIVGDEDVGGGYKAAQSLAPRLVPQVEREALFVAGV